MTSCCLLDFTPPTLCRLSSIEISKHLWTNPSLKACLIAVFKTHMPNYSVRSIKSDLPFDVTSNADFYGSDAKLENTWLNVLNHLTSNISKLELPQTLRTNLTNVANSMGFLMYDRLMTMNETSETPIDFELYLDHMHWTSLGNISMAEILQALYLSQKLPITYSTFIKLSNHCLEDSIVHFPLNSEEFVKSVTKRPSEVFKHIVPLYWYYYRQNDLDGLIPHLRTIPTTRDGLTRYKEYLTIDENMFVLSVQRANLSAIMYFWNRLDQQRRMRALGEVAEHSKSCRNRVESHITLDLVMFLWSRFCVYGISDYSMMIFHDLKPLEWAANWPWTEIFARNLERVFISAPASSPLWL